MTASEYFENDYNCSQCVVMAVMGTDAPSTCLDGCSALCAGFGVGGCCGALIGGLVCLGLSFGEDDALRLRALYLEKFSQKFGRMDCCRLRDGYDCSAIVDNAADIASEIIENYKGGSDWLTE